MPTKKELRDSLRSMRHQLPPALLHEYSQQICKQIMALPIYHTAQHIACYAAMDHEVVLDALIENAWQQGKHIYLPVIAQNHHMDFFLYERESRLTHNCFNVLEPDTHHRQSIEPTKLDLIIVPLLGFDATCNRLGQGLGFYDRFLSQYSKEKTITTLGVGYELQKVAQLPTHSWDIPLDHVVTEERVYTMGIRNGGNLSQ